MQRRLRFLRPLRSGRSAAFILLGTVFLGTGCAAFAPSRPAGPSYEFFATADPAADPWFAKIEDWQARMLEEAGVGLIAEPTSKVEQKYARLERRMGGLVAEERQRIARSVATFALEQGRQHYRFDEDQSLEGDHWPTVRELADTNGDDCDGLDLIAYQLLIDLGFPRDQLFRAVMRRNRDRRNHMVTLWFEDPNDPWVFDATGAMTRKLARFSETAGWTPTAVFDESRQFSVSAAGLSITARTDP